MARASSLVAAGMYANTANAVFGSGQVTGQTANATTQATAASISVGITAFNTVGIWGSAVLRNEGAARMTVLNGGANALSVFPPLGGTINVGAVNAAVAVPAGKLASFLTIDGLNWYADISA